MKAFESLVHRYDRQVLALALRFSGNEEDAKDIYQEVFIRVYRSLSGFEFRSAFRTWLFRVASNVCLTHRMKTSRMKTIPIDQESGKTILIPGSEMAAEVTEQRVVRRELNDVIMNAMGQLSVSPGQKLQVEASHGGDLTVQTGGEGQVSVNVYGLDESQVQIEQRAGTIYVGATEAHGNWRDASFEITIPSQFDVDLSTKGGDIEVSGHLIGELKARTHGGDIAFSNVDGNVIIKTYGGDVKGGEVATSRSIESYAGDIEIASVAGTAAFKTHAGDIDVGSVGGSLTAKTMMGDISAERISGAADLHSMGGDIDVGRAGGSVSAKTMGGDVRVTGASGQVEVSTKGGDLELRDLTGSVHGETMGGDIYAELDPGETGSELETRAGDISLVLPSGARVTVQATVEVGGSDDEDEYGIRSDFEGQIQTGDKVIEGVFQINGGGPTITLATSAGEIQIQRQHE